MAIFIVLSGGKNELNTDHVQFLISFQIEMTSETSTTKTSTVTQLPETSQRQEPTLRLVLKAPDLKSLSQKAVEEIETLLPPKKNKQKLTDQERDRINKSIAGSLNKSLSNFSEYIYEQLKINLNDTADMVKFKQLLLEKVLDLLDSSFNALIVELKSVFEIKDPNERRKQMDTLFQSMNEKLINFEMPNEMQDVTGTQQSSKGQKEPIEAKVDLPNSKDHPEQPMETYQSTSKEANLAANPPEKASSNAP